MTKDQAEYPGGSEGASEPVSLPSEDALHNPHTEAYSLPAGYTPAHAKNASGRHLRINEYIVAELLGRVRHVSNNEESDAADLLRELPDEQTRAECDQVIEAHYERNQAAAALELDDDEGTSDSSDGDGGEQEKPRSGFWRFARDIAVVVVVALLISTVIRTFLFRPFYIPSASMHDTLVENDNVIVNLLEPSMMPVAHGDVIVFQDPGGWLPNFGTDDSAPAPKKFLRSVAETVGLRPTNGHGYLIKRVIGLPGDHVTCCNAYGQVTINGVGISEPYILKSGHPSASGVTFDVVVPPNSVWVMGDNRYNSEDSRYHQNLPSGGFVPYDNIVGRAIVVNMPLNHLGILGNYPEVFQHIPEPTSVSG